MTHQLSTVSGLAGGARALSVLYAAEISEAYLALDGFRDTDLLGLQALAPALDAVATAKTVANALLTDPRYTVATKTADASAVVAGALGAAKDAAKNYGGLLDRVKAALASKLLPKVPASADATITAFRAAELVKALEGTDGGVASVANGMLADALSQGDAVKAGILAGGLLNDTYKRLGADMGVLGQLFGKTLAASMGDASSSGKGARLLALLSQGGPDTFYGFRDWLNSTLAAEQANFDASVSSYVALGAVQGLKMGPNVDRRQTPQTVTPWPK